MFLNDDCSSTNMRSRLPMSPVAGKFWHARCALRCCAAVSAHASSTPVVVLRQLLAAVAADVCAEVRFETHMRGLTTR